MISKTIDEQLEYYIENEKLILEMKELILERLQVLPAAPITCQRLCELALQPEKNYTSLIKWMRGVYKVLQVNVDNDAMDTDE
jgi:hypothetical protein